MAEVAAELGLVVAEWRAARPVAAGGADTERMPIVTVRAEPDDVHREQRSSAMANVACVTGCGARTIRAAT